MIIGICGKSGSGKSFISNKIWELLDGYKVLDINRIGHEVNELEEVKRELTAAFGGAVVKNNEVDRKALGRIVFNSKSEMNKLTEITWVHMKKVIDKNIEDRSIILDWILLPETEYFNRCDVKILVDIPYKVRLLRAMKRDNITKKEFDEREKASIEYNTKDFDIVVTLKDQKNTDKLMRDIIKYIKNY